MNLLEARGVCRDYLASRWLWRSAATVTALQEVAFTLRAGRTLAVVGGSGAGKSARLLTLIEGAAGAWRERRRRLRRGVVFPKPFGSLNLFAARCEFGFAACRLAATGPLANAGDVA